MHSVLSIVVLAAPLSIYCQYTNYADVECGRPGTAGDTRIVGGEDAVPGEFPWLVSLRYYGQDYCGATILNDRWIVTAAHCLFISGPLRADEITAATGLYDIREPPNQDVPISRIIIHPKYNNVTYRYDIALLKTSTRIIWADNVAPACVPEDNSDDFAGRDTIVAGWGQLNENASIGGYPNILQKVTVVVLTNEDSQEWFRDERIKATITDVQLCAGYKEGGRDSCQGDSGGPVVVDEGDYMLLIGVVSSGYGCARPNQPGLCTRVSEFLDWIEGNINDRRNIYYYLNKLVNI